MQRKDAICHGCVCQGARIIAHGNQFVPHQAAICWLAQWIELVMARCAVMFGKWHTKQTPQKSYVPYNGTNRQPIYK